MTIQEIIEEIKTKTAVELCDLVHALEEEFGVDLIEDEEQILIYQYLQQYIETITNRLVTIAVISFSIIYGKMDNSVSCSMEFVCATAQTPPKEDKNIKSK